MGSENKLDLITRNLQEVTGLELLKSFCTDDNNDKQKVSHPLSLYWGSATTGRPHLAYFVPMTKLADFLRAGCAVKVLFADLHGFLDNLKAPWSLLKWRTDYYEALVQAMLTAIGVPLDKLEFVRGTDYQLSEAYSRDVYRICGMVTIHDARKAGAEVVKQVSDPLLSSLLYPLLQVLDEEHLRVDAQFGGVDQRKIFMCAEKYLPNMGCSKRIHLMNPMVPGLSGGKMSSSEPDSKIDLLDNAELVLAKLSHAQCDLQTNKQLTHENNGVLGLLKHVIFPMNLSENCVILDDGQTFADYDSLYNAACQGTVSSQQLIDLLISVLDPILAKVRAAFESPERQALIQRAYPNGLATNAASTEDCSLLSKQLLKLNFSCDSLQADVRDGIASVLLEITAKDDEVDSCSLRTYVDSRSGPGKPLTILWSCQVSGLPHIGYIIPLRALAQLSRTHSRVVILIDDLATFMTNNRCPFNQIESRGKLFKSVLSALFIKLGGVAENATFICGSEFQMSKDYMLELYQLSSQLSEDVCALAAAPDTVGAECERSLLSSLIAPCMSLLNELFIGAHIRLSSFKQKLRISQLADQIYRFKSSSSILRLSHTMLTNLSSQSDGDMRSFPPGHLNEASSLSILSSLFPAPNGSLKPRVKKIFCEPGNIAFNPVLDIFANLIFPLITSSTKEKQLIIERDEKNGGSIQIESFEQLRDMFNKQEIHPGDLKANLEVQLRRWFLSDLSVLENTETLVKNAFHSNLPGDSSKKASGDAGSSSKPSKTKSASFSQNPNLLDIRVGKILSVEKHPDADSLFVTQVDLGEKSPRTIVSGLVGRVPVEDLLNSYGIYLCNLKPAKMRNVLSSGMLLCTSLAESSGLERIEPLRVTNFDDSVSPGARVTFDSFDFSIQPEAVINNKSKNWEALLAELNVDSEGFACWKCCRMLIMHKHTISAKSIRNAPVK